MPTVPSVLTVEVVLASLIRQVTLGSTCWQGHEM